MSRVLHLMRVTIEAVSPLSFGSGDVAPVTRERREDGETKTSTHSVTALARDANGLPAIPGATVQGVLRHLFEAEHGAAEACALFGYAEGTKGKVSRLSVSFGAVHDRADQAVIGLIVDAARIANDQILSLLRRDEPLRRDHVALNARHVADGHKKFERRAVPVGTRFSIEFALWDEADQGKGKLTTILGLFNHEAFRLGGAGRQGYGRIKLVRASYARPDADKPLALRELRRELPSKSFAKDLPCDAAASGHAVSMTLVLRPINPWRVSGESDSLTEGTHGLRMGNGWAPDERFKHFAGMDLRQGENGDRNSRDIGTILRERVIGWAGTTAELRDPRAATPFDASARAVAFGVPGTAIKGPLAHRTLFHWNRALPDRSGMIDLDAWLARGEADRDEALRRLGERPDPVAALFGAAKDRAGGSGRAGRIFVDDGTVSGVNAVQGVDHNSIDRFTGGVRPGFLFTEEVLIGDKINMGGGIATTITVLPPRDTDGETAREAFLRALRDLCQGRLAIGAKSLGFCAGSITAWGGDPDLVTGWKATWDKLAPEAVP